MIDSKKGREKTGDLGVYKKEAPRNKKAGCADCTNAMESGKEHTEGSRFRVESVV